MSFIPGAQCSTHPKFMNNAQFMLVTLKVPVRVLGSWGFDLCCKSVDLLESPTYQVHPGTTGKPVVNLSMKFHWTIWPLVLALGVRCCTRDLGTARRSGHWWSLHEIAAGPPWNVQSTSGALWWIFDGYSFLAVVLQGHFGSSWVLQKSPRLHRAWVNPKSLQSLKMWYFVATIAEMTCVDPCPRWWKEQRCLGVFERSYIYYLLYYI